MALNLPYFSEMNNGQPMDLGTVRAKLNSGVYKYEVGFAADERLIFSNCYLFNGVVGGSSKMAQRMEGVIEKAFRSAFKCTTGGDEEEEEEGE